MYIEEVEDQDRSNGDDLSCSSDSVAVVSDAKRVLVGAGARALFYPTLLYNLVRNKIQSEFRWWDRVDELRLRVVGVGVAGDVTSEFGLMLFEVHCHLDDCIVESESVACKWLRVLILLGAVPFPADVPRLRELGVSGVVTLNEPYETLVPTSLYHLAPITKVLTPDFLLLFLVIDLDYSTLFWMVSSFRRICLVLGRSSLYKSFAGSGAIPVPMELCYPKAHNIDHLVIPTRDYLFAPSFADICQAVDFIHENASLGKTTYVHCKAGRGRSTTIVLCYLVKHRQMSPDTAYEYVRSIRPRVLLASSQWQAVQEYYHIKVKKTRSLDHLIVGKSLALPAEQDGAAFDDDSVIIVTESDLDGYEASCDSIVAGNDMLTDLSLTCKVQCASQAVVARFSCLWLRCNTDQKTTGKKLGSSVGGADQLGSIGVVNIRVY
ncbi:hypothetical protein JRO89_XSUnG0186900 [Xanthoceras sorbifolium]|uniref:Dual specificity protein phosphatase DSP8 n=1 Tax=Xanthoceras sorbifolium TaxID=99658 RepID=A0ABQ8GXC9_9ROSI|nr:hypothetical protein JRO89_XSUnG0186900 [Xanthoceras sorbifolium]